MNGFLIILGIFRWTFILVLIRVFCWTGAHWVRRIYIPWYTFLASTLGSSLGSCSVLFTESFGSLHWGFRPRKIRDPFELQKTSEKNSRLHKGHSFDLAISERSSMGQVKAIFMQGPLVAGSPGPHKCRSHPSRLLHPVRNKHQSWSAVSTIFDRKPDALSKIITIYTGWGPQDS